MFENLESVYDENRIITELEFPYSSEFAVIVEHVTDRRTKHNMILLAMKESGMSL